MKILIVNEYKNCSGAETIVSNLIKYLESRNHKIKLLFKQENCNTLSKTYNTNNFIQEIKNFKPDIVHFHNITGIGLDPIRYCVNNNIKCVLTLHDYYIVCRNRTYYRFDKNKICGYTDYSHCNECVNNILVLEQPFILDKELKEMIKLGKFVLVCISNTQKSIVEKFGYDNIVVIYNGIDTDVL